MQISSGDSSLSIIVFLVEIQIKIKEQTICFWQTRSICFLLGFQLSLSNPALLHPRTRGEYLPGKDILSSLFGRAKDAFVQYDPVVWRFEKYQSGDCVDSVQIFRNGLADLRCVWKGSELSESIAKVAASPIC